MQDDRRRIVVFSAAGAVFVLIVVVMLIVYFIGNIAGPREGEIRITNYNEYVENIASSEQSELQKALYDTAALNVENAEGLSDTDDAVIRSDSYNQTFEDNVYTTSFIVDIESLQQSYKIQNLYSSLDQEDSGLYDYTRLALCLQTSELKYGEFVCKDRLSIENGVEQSDPILQYLPESTLEYTLELDSSSDELKIIASLNLTGVDYSLGVDEAVERYKNSIADWFISKNLDINNYSITYEY